MADLAAATAHASQPVVLAPAQEVGEQAGLGKRLIWPAKQPNGRSAGGRTVCPRRPSKVNRRPFHVGLDVRVMASVKGGPARRLASTASEGSCCCSRSLRAPPPAHACLPAHCLSLPFLFVRPTTTSLQILCPRRRLTPWLQSRQWPRLAWSKPTRTPFAAG